MFTIWPYNGYNYGKGYWCLIIESYKSLCNGSDGSLGLHPIKRGSWVNLRRRFVIMFRGVIILRKGSFPYNSIGAMYNVFDGVGYMNQLII